MARQSRFVSLAWCLEGGAMGGEAARHLSPGGGIVRFRARMAHAILRIADSGKKQHVHDHDSMRGESAESPVTPTCACWLLRLKSSSPLLISNFRKKRTR